MTNATWKKLVKQGLIALSLLLLASVPVFAAGHECSTTSIGRLTDIQSRSAIKHYVQCAVQHVEAVGWKQAIQDFETEPQWRDGPMYLFGTDTEGVAIFNVSGSTSPGDQRLQAQDADGKLHVQRMLYTVQVFGGGFTTYRFRNPQTESLDLKVTYAHPVSKPYLGRDAWLGAGYYPVDVPGACHPERVRASLVHSLEDAESFVRCAEIYLKEHGLRALYDFRHDPRWHSGPTYLFLLDYETLIQVMNSTDPTRDGQYLGDLEDSTGYRFVEEEARTLPLFGEQVMYYEFPNPATGAVEPKISYIRLMEFGGHEYILGAGIYVPTRSVCRDMPTASEVDTKPELEIFVRCAADLVAERGAEAFDLLLQHPAWIDGAIYAVVMDQKCQDLVYPWDYRADYVDCEDSTDAEGTFHSQNIVDIATSDEGAGYTSYLWLNPATGKEERKTSYVVGVELEGEIVAVIAGLYNLKEKEKE